MHAAAGGARIDVMAPLISTPAVVSHGAQLIFETLTADVTLRLRPHEDTLLRVIDGVAELRFDGEEHLLGPGGEAVVPAGYHHTLCSVTGQARIVMGYREPRT
jgi:mannose-6-phosphate isomerase-like protein (cupin superfamily)